MKYKPKKDIETELRNVITSSETSSEVLRKMNMRTGGNNYNVLKKWIEYYKIDISHFKPLFEIRKDVAKFAGCKSKPLEDLLISDISYNSVNLKNRLYKEGLKQRQCELCGQGEEWNNMKISLIIDHIDGNHRNNLLTNLRIVCPNCNAGLDTHCSKNKNSFKNKEKVIKKKIKREDIILKNKIHNDNLINQIKNSNIDFSKYGWRLELAKILNGSPQNAGRVVKKLIPELWEICWKHKIT